MLQMTVIRPADDLGPVLTSRSVAEDLRARIEDAARTESVVVDFEGVEAVSPSFADEVFAKVPRDFVASGRIRFENLSADLQRLVEFVVTARERHAS